MTLAADVASNTLTAARQTLATALETATGYTAHASMTTNLTTPCYIIQPDGWQWLTGGGYAAYRVTITCLYGDQSGDTAVAVEELARAAAVVCSDEGWRIPDVPAPGTVQNPADPGRPLAGVQFTTTTPVALRSA